MLVLGVDPGTRHLGWGVVRREGARVEHVAHGVIATDAREEMAMRLVAIADALGAVIAAHRPEVAAVETLFFHKDPTAAAKLGQARGVVLLSVARAGVALAEYQPALVKRTIANHGRADKAQIARNVGMVLGLGELPRADATDALALALTHLRCTSTALPLARPRLRGSRTENEALLRLARERRVVVGHQRTR
jgi:crossover junction endodeoxyribonuclease RuvC